MNNILHAIVFSCIFGACSEDIEFDSKIQNQVIHVASKTAKTNGHPYYWVSDSLNSWNLLKEEICGFEHEEGYEYILDVTHANGCLQLNHIIEKKEKVSKVPVFFFCDDYVCFDNDEFDYSTSETSINNKSINFPMHNDSVFLVQGDMLFTEEELFKRFCINGVNHNTRGAIFKDTSTRWPNNIVYYVFNSNFYNRNLVLDAMSRIEASTNIKFVERTNQSNYIEFVLNTVNNSHVGMKGGRQVINLSSNASYGNAMHEICHALGMIHEQCRPDRDNYVIIYWDNITSGKEHNFDLYSTSVVDMVGTFDFSSIMLYSSNAFAKPNTYTMKTTNNAVFQGQRSYLSDRDIQTLEYGYPPLVLLEHNENIIVEYQQYLDDLLEWEDDYYLLVCNNPIQKSNRYYSESKTITITKTRRYYDNSRNRYNYEIKDSTIVIPPGVSRVNLGTVHNYDNYYMSNPVKVDVTTYSIL